MSAPAEGSACPAWLPTLDIWTDTGLHADPYPMFEELRACPMGRSEALGGYWVASRYADVLAVLQDSKSFSNEVLFVPPTKDPSGRRIPIELDPPEHGPFKAMLAQWFSPPAVRKWESRAREHFRSLLAAVEGRDEVEFVSAVAVSFPFLVMGEVFGLDTETVDMLREWDEAGMRKGTNDLEARRTATRSTRVRMLEFFGDLAEQRSKDSSGPASGMIDELVRAELDGERLSRDVIANICVTMWNAGLHTTSNVLSNSMVHLSARPELRDRLRAEPDIVPGAVEELMRYESIVSQARVVVRDVTIGDQRISAGDHIVTLTGSAGRDSDVYDQPDVIDFDRTNKRHLMFGAGLHRCIGAHVARMELQIALSEIHAAWPNYRADPARPARRHTGLERGTDELWLLL
ncbi:cytochrome P450 [Nocardia sp. CA-135953]|uniref:cytochrome P450 n=1 Tax=Nocardia sp. CA-135953 TaxID=3239978 RepID=UPI003D994F9C